MAKKALAPYKDTKKGMKRSQEEIRNILVETRTELKNNLNNLYGFGDALMRVEHMVYLIWEEPWLILVSKSLLIACAKSILLHVRYSPSPSLNLLFMFVVTAYLFEHLDQVLFLQAKP